MASTAPRSWRRPVTQASLHHRYGNGRQPITGLVAHYADQTSSEADTMSIIERDYLPERRPVEIPPELALLMIRKAAELAAKFEERALDEMTKAARRHLRDGQTTEQVAWQLGIRRSAQN